MWPKPEIQPGRNVSNCPACGNPKPANEAQCLKCSTRACPKCLNILGHEQKICDKCNWYDYNFKSRPVRSQQPSSASKIPETIDNFGEKSKFKCPQCGLPVKDELAPCSNCGKLSIFHIHQSNKWSNEGTFSNTPPLLKDQPIGSDEVKGKKIKEQAVPLHDYASKESFLKTGSISESADSDKSVKHSIESKWTFDDDTRQKKPGRVLLAGVVIFVAIIIGAAVLFIDAGQGNNYSTNVPTTPSTISG